MATVHSPQPTVHSPQPTVHSPQSTVHSPQSTVHSPQSTVHSPQSTVHSPQSTVHSPQSTVHSPQSAVCSLQSTVHSPQSAVHCPQSTAPHCTALHCTGLHSVVQCSSAPSSFLPSPGNVFSYGSIWVIYQLWPVQRRRGLATPLALDSGLAFGLYKLPLGGGANGPRAVGFRSGLRPSLSQRPLGHWLPLPRAIYTALMPIPCPMRGCIALGPTARVLYRINCPWEGEPMARGGATALTQLTALGPLAPPPAGNLLGVAAPSRRCAGHNP